MKSLCLLLFIILSFQAHSGNYQLQYSEIFQSCSFIHDDEYSVSSMTTAIKGMLETKLEGDRACNASFNKLHAELSNIDRLINQEVDKSIALEIYDETYSKYIQDLTQETLGLDPNDPIQGSRYLTLTAQIDALKTSLLQNQYNLQLNKETFKRDRSSNFRKDLYNYASGVFTALNEAPVNCINKLGGWEQMLPAVLKIGGMVGTFMGPSGPIIGAGFTAASQLAILLQNADLKSSINNIERRKNEAILACTYQSLQTTACELARADKFVSNQAKINDIIFNRFPEGQNGDYERYFKALNLLPKIYDILTAIGKMGSAITLDLNVMSQYVQAVRIDPLNIKIPDASSDDLTIKKWLLSMKARGLTVIETNPYTMTSFSVREQFENVKKDIQLNINTISTVTAILKENRSFVDLHSELMKKGINLAKEIKFLQSFLDSFPTKENFPKQFKGIFLASKTMLKSLSAYLSITYDEEKYPTIKEFEDAINDAGRALFDEMSKGSVAQISAQTVLMIPEIAYQRFTRPFESIEQYYLNQDIAAKDDPNHPSYSEFVIYRSLQIKVAKDYQLLTGSKKAHRLENYETTRKSFEKGFKSEIYKMVKNALNAKSEVLTAYEGKTAAHMCALFSGFLKKNYPLLHKQCVKEHKSLELWDVLGDFNKTKDMPIDYDQPCFYNDYKREENGQRILFERLKDYGNGNL